MSERRLIFYSDGRHTHIYAYDPPLRVEDAVAPIDDVAGSGVDTFVYGFGSGPTMYHNTKVGETWAEHLVEAGPSMSAIKPAWATFLEADVWNTLPFWRAYQNLKSLRERGLDIMELLIDRAHEKGMEFWEAFARTIRKTLPIRIPRTTRRSRYGIRNGASDPTGVSVQLGLP